MKINNWRNGFIHPSAILAERFLQFTSEAFSGVYAKFTLILRYFFIHGFFHPCLL